MMKSMGFGVLAFGLSVENFFLPCYAVDCNNGSSPNSLQDALWHFYVLIIVAILITVISHVHDYSLLFY
jgi:hypothetical protein